jgi:hypothetical protein
MYVPGLDHLVYYYWAWVCVLTRYIIQCSKTCMDCCYSLILITIPSSVAAHHHVQPWLVPAHSWTEHRLRGLCHTLQVTGHIQHHYGRMLLTPLSPEVIAKLGVRLSPLAL